MGSIAEEYCGEVRNDSKLYFALWTPERRLEPGAVGTIRSGSFFVPDNSHVRDFGMDSPAVEDDDPGEIELKSSKSVSISLKIAGETNPDAPNLPNAKAGVVVKFGKEASYIIRAGEVYENALSRIDLVKERVLELYRADKWPKDRVVVSSIVLCKKADILISRSSQNTVQIMAKGDIPAGGTVSLGDAEVEFELITSSGDQYNFLNTENCTPLFQLVGLKRSFPLVGRRNARTLRMMADVSDPALLAYLPDNEIKEHPEMVSVDLL